MLTKRLLFFVLLLAAGLRFYGLDRLGLWADELWVVMDSSRGTLWDMLLTVYYKDNHPPGHYLLSRYSQLFIGASDFAIRLPSALAGTFLVAVTFFIGKKRLSPEAALIAAVLVAGSYQGIYHSQEARPNIFVALFILLSLHYFLKLLLEGDLCYKNFTAFWLFSTLNAYFHYVGLVFLFTLFIIYLGVLLIYRNKNQLLLGLKIFGPILLFYLPWLPGMYYDLANSPPELWQHVPTLKTLVSSFLYLFGPGDLRVYVYALVFVATPFWILVLFLVKPWREKYVNHGKTATLFWLCIVLPVAIFYLKSIYSQPAYNHRHFLHAIPMMSLLVGAVLAKFLSFTSNKNRPTLLIITVGFVIFYQWMTNNNHALYQANHFKQDYRESAKLVVDQINYSKNDQVIILSNSRFFDHYLDYFSKGHQKISFLLSNMWEDGNVPDNMISLEPHATFYYLEAPAIPAANEMVTLMDQFLSQRYRVICRNRLKRTQVILFENTKPLTEDPVSWKDLPVCITEK